MKRLLHVLLLLLATAASVAWADTPLRLGVLAYRPKVQVLAEWQPLASYLQRTLGQRVELSVHDPAELETAVARGSVDVVLTTSGHFIALKHRYGLPTPLATQITRGQGQGLTRLGGVIFTRADQDGIERLQDLEGRRIAVPSLDFTGSYQMQALELLEAGLPLPDPSMLLLTGLPQDLTVEAVMRGQADVGFVRTGILEALAHEGKLDLRQVRIVHPIGTDSFPYLHSTRLYPEWPMVVMPHVDERARRQLAMALFSLPGDSDAARAAGVSGFTIPADYGSVEAMMHRLHLPPFDGAPEFTLADLWGRYAALIVAALGLLTLLFAGIGAGLIIQNANVRRSQAQYREQSQRVSEILWGTNAGTWEWNVQTGEVVLNERWAEILGYTLAELAPINIHTWMQRAHPEDLKRSSDLVEQCFRREQETYKCELRMRHKDGEWIWTLNRGRVVEWRADGQPLRMSGTLADITARKRAEQRERHHNRILAMLAQKMPLPTVLDTFARDVEAIRGGARCCILLLEDDGKHLRLGAAPSLSADYRAAMDGLRVGAGTGACGTAAFRGERSIVTDIATHPDCAPYRALAQADGLAACWSEPIISTQNRVIGTLALYLGQSASPTPDDIQLIEDEARLAALVVERTASEASLQLAASVFTHAREGIMIAGADGTILEVNDTFTHITGYTRAEIIGQNPRILQSGRQDREFYQLMWKTLHERDHWSGEIWNRRKDGEIYAESLTISAVRDTTGAVQNYVALFTDITSTKEHQRQLEHFAHYDALTGLPNRVLLADRLQQAMSQSLRRDQSLAVAYLDLDGFKAVNDRYTHGVGDELLIAIAQRMKAALRDGDTLARIGGDEFVAVLVDLEHPQDCESVLQRLLLAAATPLMVGDILLQVSASIGVTRYPQDASDADQLMRHADQAMYVAKLAGKNRCHHFDIEQDVAVKTRHEDLEHIQQALAQREFVLHYQPKVSMKSGQVVGAEALIRWQHPEQGLLPPSAFLPVIENHPVSVELGEWVIDTALAQMGIWARAGLHLPVSVNIGARQLQQGDFVDRLSGLLRAHPEVPPMSLELEVLETSAMEDIGRVSNVMQSCRALGVGFALDDFGTGYSSLTYLKHLPAELLKIDQSFVRDMLDDPDDLAIVESVIGLAGAFRRNVIAEGVETAAHGELLLTLGCEQAQGYGIARPMPASELPNWVAQWRPDPSWTAWRQRVLSRDDKAMVFIEVGHRHWLRSLEAFLENDHAVPPPLEAGDCHFGRWQVGEGQARFGAAPQFHVLVELHNRIHGMAQAIVSTARHESATNIQASMDELRHALDQLAQQLRELVRH